MRNLKQERYDQLAEKDENLTNEELEEQVQLFYELNPDVQYWRDTSPNLTPRDVWGVDTSCYGS